jgi:RHH-type rel operon transcriptional repressor/antitoxin RelB
MAVSVRMDPLLERELEAAARLQGVSKSQFIIDAVERALGRKNPYELLLKVREEVAGYSVSLKSAASEPARAGESTRQRVRRVLKARHDAACAPEPVTPAPAARKRAGKAR